MKETVNYKLKKPELSDVVNIDDLNSNMDILDKEVKNIDTKKADVSDLDKKVDKVSGKGLSTNDYTDTDKLEVTKIKDKADKSYVDVEISKAGKVKSVNGLEGDVVLHGDNIKLNATSNELIGKTINNKADKKDITNYASISSEKDTGEVTTLHSRQINASVKCKTSGGFSQINGSSTSSVSGDGGIINASTGCEIFGNDSMINSSRESSVYKGAAMASISNSQTSHVKASRASISNSSASLIQPNADMSSVENSQNSYILSKWSKIQNALNSQTDEMYTTVVNSRGVKARDWFTFSGGDSGSNDASSSTQNIKWELNSQSGTIKSTGSITGNSSFADFAEYMESEDGKSIPFGTMITLGKGQKIRIAEDGDVPVGVVSATAGLILNAQGFEWADRYLYDRYGQPILVDKEVDGKMGKYPMINPDYDPDVEYIPREDRPEWNVVGMKGQIYVNIDDTVEEGGYVKPTKHGIATRGIIVDEYDGVQATKMWKVMEITTPYEEELGHGIARIII